MHTEDWKRELCDVFFARSGIIKGTAAVIFIGSILVAFLWPATYSASSSIRVHGAKTAIRSASADKSMEAGSLSASKEDATAEAEILMSPDLIRRTLQALKPAAGDAFTAVGSEEEAAAVRRFKGKLKVTAIPSANVIKLSLRDRDAAWAERALDVLLDQYIGYRSAVFNPVDQEAFFAAQMDLYRKKLEVAGNQLGAKVKETSVSQVSKELENNLSLKMELSRQLNALRDQFLSSSFIDNKPIEARMKLVEMTIRDIEDRNVELQRQSIDFRRLEREADLLQFSYETFARRAEEARIDRATTASNMPGAVDILSRAAFSTERVFPKRLLTILLGIVVGLLAGCGMGLVVEYSDHTFKKPGDVTKYAGLPVIGSIKKLE